MVHPGRLYVLAAVVSFATANNQSQNLYSEDIGEYFVDYAGASYCAGNLGNGVDKWSCSVCKKHPNVNATAIYHHSTAYNFNGFVAYDYDTNMVILSIAGTDPFDIKNWISDLNFFKVDYDLCTKHGNETCNAHGGFLQTYEVAKVEVRSVVEYYLNLHPSATFHITGHSLGAILAVLAAVDLHLEMGVDVASVYTMGQPRGGDAAWANFVSLYLGNSNRDDGKSRIPYYRITHYTDPVPQLPPSPVFEFFHPPQEVYYTGLGSLSKHKSCSPTDGEDRSCSDKHFIDGDVVMHLEYIGFDFVSNYLSCKL